MTMLQSKCYFMILSVTVVMVFLLTIKNYKTPARELVTELNRLFNKLNSDKTKELVKNNILELIVMMKNIQFC